MCTGENRFGQPFVFDLVGSCLFAAGQQRQRAEMGVGANGLPPFLQVPFARWEWRRGLPGENSPVVLVALDVAGFSLQVGLLGSNSVGGGTLLTPEMRKVCSWLSLDSGLGSSWACGHIQSTGFNVPAGCQERVATPTLTNLTGVRFVPKTLN